ncbi:MAG: tRNA (adenosine(37)-N6)-threonylcarbamoyltransferase complex dimerization subunit type 1 TsaB [Marinifilaceae bacterium]
MALILNIETSTTVCSVALAKDGEVIQLKECNEGANHSVVLGEFIDALLKEQQLSVSNLDAIAISMGPGSYTGLRIGVSMAKGLCYGANIPLIAIPTLKAMAHAMSSKHGKDIYYCPMIDARRMEVYTALYNVENMEISGTEAKVIDETSFQSILDNHEFLFFGNGSEKLTQTIVHPNAHFEAGVITSAQSMAPLAESYYVKGTFEDVAYFEPFYLKDFIATTPKKSVLER